MMRQSEPSERIRAAEEKQRELEWLEAEKQAQAVIRVNKRKASCKGTTDAIDHSVDSS